MKNTIVTVNVRKFDGSLHRTWTCELVSKNDKFIELIGEFKETIVHSDLGTIEAGTISREFYWFDEFYSIFVFKHPAGSLRNYYCNINLPPTFNEGVLEYIDLDMDVLVNADLSYQVLDAEEFAENSVKYSYTSEIVANVHSALEKITAMINAREFPFDTN